MEAQLRRVAEGDVERCVELGVAAFRPIFVGWEEGYGKALFDALRPDWEHEQAEYIREVCTADDRETWVAVVEDRVVGFIALYAESDSPLGRIEILAVDPDHQRSGIGTRLNELAVERFTEMGMSFVVLGTGSDEGHEPARRSYEKAGFTKMPIHPVHYYREL